MRYLLAEQGRVFSTRVRGAELRDGLLAATSSGEEVVVDFENVLSATNSFLDEFVGKLAEHRRVECANATPVIERTIDKMLRRRGIRAGATRPVAFA